MSGLTIDDPVKFEQAITSKNVIPGDVLYLRAGTYAGDWVVGVGGIDGSPVTFRPYNNEQVIISGGLTLLKGYIEFENIIIQQPDAAKDPIYISQPGTTFTDCDVSGGYIGVKWFGSGAGALVRVNIHDTASYGIYTHNNNGGLRQITDCIFDNIGGYYAMHLYSESANAIRDYTISGCTINKPTIVHSGDVRGVTFTGNTFNSWLKIGNGYSASDTRQVVVDGNTFAGVGSGVTGFSWSDLEITDNIFAITTDPATSQQTNIFLLAGDNAQRTVIDRNHYTDGDFNLENSIKAFAEWQAEGFDAAGTYQ